MSDERDQDTAMTGELARANSYAAELETLRARVEELESVLNQSVEAVNSLPSVTGLSPVQNYQGIPIAIRDLQESYRDAARARNGMYTKAEARLRDVSEALEKKLERVNCDDVHGEYKAILGDYVRFEDHDAFISGLRVIVEGK